MLSPVPLASAGPATGGDARYLAVRADDLTVAKAFRLYPDGSGDDGGGITRFREWKQALLGR